MSVSALLRVWASHLRVPACACLPACASAGPQVAPSVRQGVCALTHVLTPASVRCCLPVAVPTVIRAGILAQAPSQGPRPRRPLIEPEQSPVP